VEAPWVSNYEDGVPFSLTYPPVPLPHFLRESAQSFPQNVAMVFAGKKFSYREVQEYVDALAHALFSLGVQKGDRVALLLPIAPPTSSATPASSPSGLSWST